MSSRQTDNIEALSEWLGSLQIEALEESTSNEWTDIEMSVTLAPAPMEVIGQENNQAGLLKNIVPDPGWFDSNRTKFEDWWRRILPQKQQSSCSQWKDYSSTSLTQREHSRNLCIEEDWRTRRHWWYPELGGVCRRNQDNIQRQEQSSRCRIENRNIQAGQEIHCGLHDRIQSIGHEGKHRQFTYHILIKEEYLTWYYQDNIRLSTHSNVWDTQGVESSNHISRTRIQIHRRVIGLQDQHWNDL